MPPLATPARLLVLAAILVAPLASACHTTRTTVGGVPEVEWGSSFGMCVGYCDARLVVTPDGTATLTEVGTRSPELTPRVRSRALTMDEMQALALARATSTVQTDTLGCPDCADGGAEYVATGGQRVTFEFGGDAGPATPLARAMRTIRETFPSDPSGR